MFVPLSCVGVAYTSECFPCRPGWFSPTPGSSSCQPCHSNSFSMKGASSCTRCPEHYYSRMCTCSDSFPVSSEVTYLPFSLLCVALLLQMRDGQSVK